MKLILFTTIFVLSLVFLLPGIFSLRIKYLPAEEQPSLDRTVKLYGEKVLKQKFISAENNLTVIGLSIKNPNLLNKEDIKFNLIEEGDMVIRNTGLNGANIGDGAFMKFNFEPVVDSKGKTYEFTLSSPNGKDENALEPFITDNKSSDVGQLFIGQDEATGSGISFVSFYKPGSKIILMSEIYSNWFGRLTKDASFFLIYLLLITSLSGYLILVNFPNFNLFVRKNLSK